MEVKIMTNKTLEVRCKTYHYRGFTIHQITKKDYCVYTVESGCSIDSLTLKGAKAEIDALLK